MFKYYLNIVLMLLLFTYSSCNKAHKHSDKKHTILTTETVIPGNFGDHDTLDFQLTIFEDSTYSLSYKKTILDPDNIYGGEIHTEYKNGKAKIIKDSIFLTEDTLHLFNGYIEFIKVGKIDIVRSIDSTSLTYNSTYSRTKYPNYHIIQYETWTTNWLKDKKEFQRIFEINDETLFEIEQLVKDTVDKIMPTTKIVGDEYNTPFVTPKLKKEFLKTPNGELCCYYSSYYKKVLPYIDQNGHLIIQLFLSLEAKHILGADLPMISDGGYYFLDIVLNLTEKKITWIGHH